MATITEEPTTVEEEITELDIVNDVLLRAERYIRERGWYQGYFYDTVNPTGARCMMGALQYVTNCDYRLMDRAYYQLLKVVKMHIPSWNDVPDRTVEEVYAAFQKAREVK